VGKSRQTTNGRGKKRLPDCVDLHSNDELENPCMSPEVDEQPLQKVSLFTGIYHSNDHRFPEYLTNCGCANESASRKSMSQLPTPDRDLLSRSRPPSSNHPTRGSFPTTTSMSNPTAPPFILRPMEPRALIGTASPAYPTAPSTNNNVRSRYRMKVLGPMPVREFLDEFFPCSKSMDFYQSSNRKRLIMTNQLRFRSRFAKQGERNVCSLVSMTQLIFYPSNLTNLSVPV